MRIGTTLGAERMVSLIEMRIHGRGGQGVNTVGHLLAQAFFESGKYVQSFATYGGERRGSPVTAFVRVHDQPIRLRCDVEFPDAVMLFEPTFLEDGTGLIGVRPGTMLVINTARPPASYAHLGEYAIATVDALDIARRNGLGRIVNSAVLGAFARATGWLTLAQIEQAVQGLKQPEKNLIASRTAYKQTQMHGVVKAGG